MNETVKEVTEKIRKQMYGEKPVQKPVARHLALSIGQEINVSGINMEVVNIARQSITVRPRTPPTSPGASPSAPYCQGRPSRATTSTGTRRLAPWSMPG